jgi:hypothetical protein
LREKEGETERERERERERVENYKINNDRREVMRLLAFKCKPLPFGTQAVIPVQ